MFASIMIIIIIMMLEIINIREYHIFGCMCCIISVRAVEHCMLLPTVSAWLGHDYYLPLYFVYIIIR